MIEIIKAIYCNYYEAICKHLKKQDKLVDYKVSDGLAINKEGKLIDTIDITFVPKRSAKYIKMDIIVTPNGI